jgi:hypothetical protein
MAARAYGAGMFNSWKLESKEKRIQEGPEKDTDFKDMSLMMHFL